MARVRELILETFEDLLDEDMKYFRWHLSTQIPRSKLEGRDRLDTVDLLVMTCSYDAVTVTVEILMKMQQKWLADKLKKKYEEGKKL